MGQAGGLEVGGQLGIQPTHVPVHQAGEQAARTVGQHGGGGAQAGSDPARRGLHARSRVDRGRRGPDGQHGDGEVMPVRWHQPTVDPDPLARQQTAPSLGRREHEHPIGQ